MSEPATFGDTDLEQPFRTWCRDNGTSESTIETYWNYIKDTPYFDITSEDQKAIRGTINANLSSNTHASAMRQFVQFLFERHKSQLTGTAYEDFKDKKDYIVNGVELDEKASRPSQKTLARKRYIPTDALYKMLDVASPERTKFWLCLYCGGVRIGELKKITPHHLKPDKGDHGGITIPEDKSKSSQTRTVTFLCDLPYKLLQDAPTGDWTDPNTGITHSDVFFPDFSAPTERYYIRKYAEKPGGISPDKKTPHSLRHTRITHLTLDSDLSKDDIRRRSGHSSGDTTNLYTTLDLDQMTIMLERYCEKKDRTLRGLIS